MEVFPGADWYDDTDSLESREMERRQMPILSLLVLDGVNAF